MVDVERITLTQTTMHTKYQELVVAYNKAFDHFNTTLFGGTLPKPIITIQTRGRKKCYGWFWANRWNENGTNVHEINMSAENVHRTKEDQCETLIHEMVHLHNAIRNIDDCNALGYHNKNFKSAAEEAGLLVMKFPGKGWAMTSLGQKAKDAVDSFTDTLPTDTYRPEVKRTYAKIWTVMCTEDDYKAFKEMQGTKSQKEFFGELIFTYKMSKTGDTL